MTIYLDHAATTPLDERVLACMLPWLRSRWGNPSSVHRYGRQARAAVERAREQVAAAINADPDEIVFTCSATEANNLAIKGCADAAGGRALHIVTTSVEHPSVRRSCEYISARYSNVSVTTVRVNEGGRVEKDEWIESVSRNHTILAAAVLVNNETGVTQETEMLSVTCREREVPLHLDAAQALGRMTLDVKRIGCALMALSAHKIYGPQGAGALFVRRGVQLRPLLHGGAQERGQRGGTESVAAIVGFGLAAELATVEMNARQAHIQQLEEILLGHLRERGIRFIINGAPEYRLPGILNLSFPNIAGPDLLIALDLNGVSVSTGSACSTGVVEISPVLAAMFGSHDPRTRGGIRISIGKDNTVEQIHQFADILIRVLKRADAQSPEGANF